MLLYGCQSVIIEMVEVAFYITPSTFLAQTLFHRGGAQDLAISLSHSHVEIPDQKPQFGLQKPKCLSATLNLIRKGGGRKGPLLTQKMSLKVRNNILRISGLYFTYFYGYGIKHLNT